MEDNSFLRKRGFSQDRLAYFINKCSAGEKTFGTFCVHADKHLALHIRFVKMQWFNQQQQQRWNFFGVFSSISLDKPIASTFQNLFKSNPDFALWLRATILSNELTLRAWNTFTDSVYLLSSFNQFWCITYHLQSVFRFHTTRKESEIISFACPLLIFTTRNKIRNHVHSWAEKWPANEYKILYGRERES